jgi:hypothetical protein
LSYGEQNNFPTINVVPLSLTSMLDFPNLFFLRTESPVSVE